jgi:hypothetical protein
MHNRDNEHGRRLDDIEDGVWEPAKKRPTDPFVNERIHLGKLKYGGVNAFELDTESHSQVRRDIAKPSHRLADIRASLA